MMIKIITKYSEILSVPSPPLPPLRQRDLEEGNIHILKSDSYIEKATKKRKLK